MKKILILSLLIFTNLIFGQANEGNLTEKIEQIIKDKKANIGVSIVDGDNKKIVDINGNEFFPMLSTVKFPIALTVLDKVQKNEFSLRQKIFIKKEELLENPDNWSPFKEKYPDGNLEITLEEALSWMVSYSDNNLTDILLRLISGPETVQKFINSKNFIIKNDEEDMHKDWESQFVNKITPNEATKLLSKFNKGKILDKTTTKWLYNAMLNNKSGGNRLKGKLPENSKIAHRTGTSFTNDNGMTGAINDMGIIELPNNKKIIICVLINNTYESFKNSEEIIADIAKATWMYFSAKK